MIRVDVDWEAQDTPGGRSSFYFGGDHDFPYYRAAVHVLLDDIKTFLMPQTRGTVNTTGQEITPSTGVATNEFTDSDALVTVGDASTGPAIANAAQVLLQWRTGQYRKGRQVRGRTFIPGITAALTVGGELTTTYVTGFQNAQGNFLDSAGDFGVWSRPTPQGGAGAFLPVESGTTWRELAILRSRR